MGRPIVKTLRDELEAAATFAQKAMEAAEADNRELTPEERTEIDGKLARARELRAQIVNLEQFNKAKAEIDDMLASGRVGTGRQLTDGGRGKGGGRGQSLGGQFVESSAFDYLKSGAHRGGSAWASPAVELYAATLLESGDGGDLVIPTSRAGIQPILFHRLTVADLLSPGTTDSNAIMYMEETIATNAAAPVAEGALKPESTLGFEAKTEAVKKVATWLPVSEEMLADAAQIKSYIDARLSQFVELAEEAQILEGDGVGPNMLGLRLRPGLAADVAKGVAPDTNADAIFRQIMAIFTTSFLMPDGIVLNPANWATIVLAKDTTGQYVGGGPFSPLPTPALWGLPVAVTPAEDAGVGLVGAFKLGAQLWRRGGIVVQASNSHADYFIRNLVAIRAERRQALTVYRPGAFGEVTGLT